MDAASRQRTRERFRRAGVRLPKLSELAAPVRWYAATAEDLAWAAVRATDVEAHVGSGYPEPFTEPGGRGIRHRVAQGDSQYPRNAFSTLAWKSCTACSLKCGRCGLAMRRPWV